MSKMIDLDPKNWKDEQSCISACNKFLMSHLVPGTLEYDTPNRALTSVIDVFNRFNCIRVEFGNEDTTYLMAANEDLIETVVWRLAAAMYHAMVDDINDMCIEEFNDRLASIISDYISTSTALAAFYNIPTYQKPSPKHSS